MDTLSEKIIASTSNKICVIAAPGAGKTTAVLLPKIQQFLEKETVSADEVLLLTFSRISANDLRGKVSSLKKKPIATTVHSYCLSFLLSENNHDIRKRVDNIVLDFEKDTFLSDLKGIFPKVHKRKLQKLLDEYSAGWATKQQEEIFNEDDQKKAFKLSVVNWLVEHEAAMMEEIIYHAVDLANKISGSKLIEKPKYIFVDEFQDLNKLEQEFVSILAKNSKLLLVVGDPDQSIYSFKFAHRDGIKEFGERQDVELHEWSISKRCPKKVLEVANQVLKQSDPIRVNLLQPLPSAGDGEVRFIAKDFQTDEFDFVINDIVEKIRSGAKPESVLILVPKKKLGQDFAEYANSQRENLRVLLKYPFSFTAKPEFSPEVQKRLLLLSLIVNPDSVLHMRTCLGMGDATHYSKEFLVLKRKYGSLRSAFITVNPEDFPRKSIRIRELCSRIIKLKDYIESNKGIGSVDDILSKLFPVDVQEYVSIRKIIDGFREEGDDVKSLYMKFLDYISTIPSDQNSIRIMTIMASKGLDADHIYIIGCNAGNIPGENRSGHLSDLEYKNEQLRLLFVGVTRSKKTLMICWSRYLKFQQSRSHHTKSVSTVKKDGKLYSVVGLSEFLQSLQGIVWEK